MNEVWVERLLALEEAFRKHDKHPRAGALVDYGATSTITGWSSRTTTNIYFMRNSGLMYVWFDLAGTSNSTAASFTLPVANNGSVILSEVIRIQDNGAWAIGLARMSIDGLTVYLYPTAAEGAWTNSGTKTAKGSFVYRGGPGGGA